MKADHVVQPEASPRTGCEEIHIAGALVHVRPSLSLSACAQMALLAQVEVMQSSPEGRVVIVLEAPSAREIVELLERVHGIEGVLNVVLVYQHAESAAAMLEEIVP